MIPSINKSIDTSIDTSIDNSKSIDNSLKIKKDYYNINNKIKEYEILK